MKVGQKEYQRQKIVPKKRMLKADILPEKNVEINETKKSHEGKQNHNSFIGKTEKADKWIADELNKGCTNAVEIKPALTPEVDQYFFIIIFRIGRIKKDITIIGKCKEHMV